MIKFIEIFIDSFDLIMTWALTFVLVVIDPKLPMKILSQNFWRRGESIKVKDTMYKAVKIPVKMLSM